MTKVEKQRVKIMSKAINKLNERSALLWVGFGLFGVLVLVVMIGSAVSNEMYLTLPFICAVYAFLPFIMMISSNTIVNTRQADVDLFKNAGINGSVSYGETLKIMPFNARDYALRTFLNFKKYMVVFTAVLTVCLGIEMVLFYAGKLTCLSMGLNNIALTAYAIFNSLYAFYIARCKKSIAVNRFFIIACFVLYFAFLALTQFDEEIKAAAMIEAISYSSWVISFAILAIPVAVVIIAEKLIVPKMKNQSWDMV